MMKSRWNWNPVSRSVFLANLRPNPIKTRNPTPTSIWNSRFPPVFLAQIPNITAKKSQIPHPAKPIGDPLPWAKNVRSNITEISQPGKWFVVTGTQKNSNVPWDSKIIQMPYPGAKVINQIPTLCPASPLFYTNRSVPGIGILTFFSENIKILTPCPPGFLPLRLNIERCIN